MFNRSPRIIALGLFLLKWREDPNKKRPLFGRCKDAMC